MAKTKQHKKNQKEKKAKQFVAQVNCRCRKNCALTIDVTTQKDIFDRFHNSPDWSEKTQFLRSIANREIAKENLNPRIGMKKRQNIFHYYLCGTDGMLQRVCLLFVSQLLQINRTSIFRAIESTESNPFAIDRRGKAATKNKSAPVDVAFVKEFIETIPCYESHIPLCNIKYLHPNLTLNEIYRLYDNVCTFKQRKAISKAAFNRIFSANFSHLRPFKSGKSSCRVCQQFNEQKKKKVLSPEFIEENEQQKEHHLSIVRQIKTEFTKCTLEPEIGTSVLTFELYRPLETPMLPVSESYDLKPLWFSNFCIYDEICKEGHMYVWDETKADRGPEEIASCIIKHIQTATPDTTKKLILYSSPGNLYQNIKLVLMLKKVFDYRSNFDTIEQRFFFPGHDKNDCNHCFDFINRKKKSTENIFAPNDWVTLISSAKQTDPKFKVNEMKANEFLSAELLLKFIADEQMDTDEKKINWSNVQKIIYNRSEPYTLHVSYFEFDGNPHQNSNETFNLLKPDELVEFQNTPLFAYLHGKFISKAKFLDLQKILKFIPEENHAFYKSIEYNDISADLDFALASYDQDD